MSIDRYMEIAQSCPPTAADRSEWPARELDEAYNKKVAYSSVLARQLLQFHRQKTMSMRSMEQACMEDDEDEERLHARQVTLSSMKLCVAARIFGRVERSLTKSAGLSITIESALQEEKIGLLNMALEGQLSGEELPGLELVADDVAVILAQEPEHFGIDGGSLDDVPIAA